MKIPILFTKRYIKIHQYRGGSSNNGNGYKNTTLAFTLFTMIGTGDDGSRCESPEPRPSGRSNI